MLSNDQHDFFAPAPAPAAAVPARAAVSARPKPQRRWLWVTTAVLAVLALVAGGFWVTQREDHGPADRRPVVLPATLLGKVPQKPEYDFGSQPNWLDNARKEFYGDDHAFGGRAYISRDANGKMQVPGLMLVVARGHFPEGADVGLALPPFTSHGRVQCANTSNAAEEGEPKNPVTGHVLCFRAEKHLTVSVFAVGNRNGTLSTADVAAAVETAWSLQ